MKFVTIALMMICLAGSATHGFAPSPSTSGARTSRLNLFERERQIAAGMFAATLLTVATISSPPADALDVGSPELLLAARSGGRAGGRAGGGSYSRSSYSSPSRTVYRSSTTIVRPATTTIVRPATTTIVRPMIAPPPIVVSPFGGYGYGNPLGGFGLGYGLGAINSGTNQMQDYRQESEIQRSKAELEVAKEKEKELENRIKALEAQSASPAANVAVAPVAQ